VLGVANLRFDHVAACGARRERMQVNRPGFRTRIGFQTLHTMFARRLSPAHAVHFTRRAANARTFAPRYDKMSPPGRVLARSFSMEPCFHPVKTLSTSIIDLGAYMGTLPLPEFLPPYSAAIIALTLLLRTGITLPVTIWVRGPERLAVLCTRCSYLMRQV
jgi:hypothetical protein